MKAECTIIKLLLSHLLYASYLDLEIIFNFLIQFLKTYPDLRGAYVYFSNQDTYDVIMNNKISHKHREIYLNEEK